MECLVKSHQFPYHHKKCASDAPPPDDWRCCLLQRAKIFSTNASVQHYPELEREAGAAVQGFEGVDIIVLASSGQPTCLFGIVATNILAQIHKQWDGQVVVAHRFDSGAGEEPGSLRACAGDHISAKILAALEPVIRKYGVHTYRAFDGEFFQDLHVDQLPLLSAYELFAEYFATELAEQVEDRPQQQPVEVAQQQLVVAHREWPVQDVGKDDVDAGEFAEYILGFINKVLEFQRNQHVELEKQILHKTVRTIVKSIVRSVVEERTTVHVCTPNPRRRHIPLADVTNTRGQKRPRI